MSTPALVPISATRRSLLPLPSSAMSIPPARSVTLTSGTWVWLCRGVGVKLLTATPVSDDTNTQW